jgi:hypothetical protein
VTPAPAGARLLVREGVLRLATAALLVASSGVVSAPADPGPVVEPEELKAAFVYNFAKFTEWPAFVHPASATPLVIGIADSPDLAEALTRAVAGRRLMDHPLEVRSVRTAGDLDGCALVFFGSMEAKRLRTMLDRVRGAPVLTVGESETFLQAGGIIRLYADAERLRFRVNLANAERGGLRLSSRLLALAVEVERPSGGGEGR